MFDDILERCTDERGNAISLVEPTGKALLEELDHALVTHLTQEQRRKLYETHGACNGAGLNKERRIFATENAHLALDERIELFAEHFKRNKPILNTDNTLTLHFKCSHGYYKRAREGKIKNVPDNAEHYFEKCADGRLYELERALMIKLKVKTVDISPLREDVNNPVVFTFEVVD